MFGGRPEDARRGPVFRTSLIGHSLQGVIRRRAGWVASPGPATEEIAVSESTQNRPDQADEQAPKPGEQDTETVAGQPRKAPESKDGEQSKQDE